DRELAAQAIERETLDQLVRRLCLTVEQQRTIAARPDEEIEQRLALRGEQSGVDRERAGDVVGHEALQELGGGLGRIVRGDAYDRAREQAFVGHEPQVGPALAIVK